MPPSFCYTLSMESAPSSFDRIKPYKGDPSRIEVVIDRQSSATFAFNPETKQVVQTGVSVDASSLDIPPEQFIGASRLRQAAERARKYFETRPIAQKPEASVGSQYELDLEDETRH